MTSASSIEVNRERWCRAIPPEPIIPILILVMFFIGRTQERLVCLREWVRLTGRMEGRREEWVLPNLPTFQLFTLYLPRF